MQKGVKLLLFIVIPILLVIIGAILYLSNKNTSKPEVKVDSRINPWAQAEKVSTSSEVPSVLELDAKYKQVHEAVRTRNYEAFKKLASSERIWHVENPKKLIGEESTGEAIFELLTPRGLENFVRNAPYGVLIKAPNPKDVVAVDIREKEPSTRPNLVVIDPLKSNQKTLVTTTVWKSSVDLIYNLNNDAGDTGTGYVGFVWDNGEWKYNGEYWETKIHQIPTTLGDKSAKPAVEITVGGEGGCLPQSTKVNVGEAVAWKSMTGRVYTISPSPVFWHSDYLYNDTFIKKFDTSGTYTYLVQRPTVEPQDAKECIIRVN